MTTQTPCSDYVETRGVVFFARLVDKIRLQSADLLPPGYYLGLADPTYFDARFCRYWEVDYDRIRALALAGRSNEGILDEVLGTEPLNPVRVLAWNAFITKRGWRDTGTEGLAAAKTAVGLADRDDILTYADLHDADEGRPLRFATPAAR